MSLTEGRPEIGIALIDGPVNTNLPEFASSSIKDLAPGSSGKCDRVDSIACMHGTLVAGVLVGSRGSTTPAICPGCTLLVRPIFGEMSKDGRGVPVSSPEGLAAAIIEVVNAGARIVNLSCGLSRCSARGERSLCDALDFAATRGVIVIAAAGNQARVGGSCITKNPWVIPVISIDGSGRPSDESNLSASIGQGDWRLPGKTSRAWAPMVRRGASQARVQRVHS